MLKGTKYILWMVDCIIACLLLITLTVPFTSALVSLYTIPITEEFDIPRSAYTLTTTILAACGIVLSPIVGKMIFQKYNVKLILSIGILVFSLSYMSNGLAQ